MLDVRRMRVLREVAVRGSFSAAAEALSFTQSAVSQQIAALEREAGTVLVQRSARGVKLTQAGEAIVRHTEAILARLAEAEAELEAIAAFRERHPAVELSMSLQEPEDALPQLRAGELDLVVVFSPGAADATGDELSLTHLLEDPLLLVLPA